MTNLYALQFFPLKSLVDMTILKVLLIQIQVVEQIITSVAEMSLMAFLKGGVDKSGVVYICGMVWSGIQ